MFDVALPVRAVVLGVGLLAAACASAQTATIICGGNKSKKEFEGMYSDMKNHALTLLYISGNATYLSNVETRIEDASGQVVAQNPTCGPLGQVDVNAAGNYKITVRYNGKAQTREVALKPKGGERVMFTWE